jgi:hypothetical protein
VSLHCILHCIHCINCIQLYHSLYSLNSSLYQLYSLYYSNPPPLNSPPPNSPIPNSPPSPTHPPSLQQIKYFLPDPVANDVKYQASAQPFLVLGLLTTGLAIGHHNAALDVLVQ